MLIVLVLSLCFKSCGCADLPCGRFAAAKAVFGCVVSHQRLLSEVFCGCHLLCDIPLWLLFTGWPSKRVFGWIRLPTVICKIGSKSFIWRSRGSNLVLLMIICRLMTDFGLHSALLTIWVIIIKNIRFTSKLCKIPENPAFHLCFYQQIAAFWRPHSLKFSHPNWQTCSWAHWSL